MAHALKETLCNMFRRRREVPEQRVIVLSTSKRELTERALPPLPNHSPVPTLIVREDESAVDFAASIEKVKDVCRYFFSLALLIH